jgi:hypothetical protein
MTSPHAADDLPPLPPLTLGRYRHYKQLDYEVVGVARHSEDLSPFVVYRPLYKASGWWIRPYAMFVEAVEVDGVRQPRFALIEPAAAAADAAAGGEMGDCSSSGEQEGDTMLLDTLRTLEMELHHPGSGACAIRLKELLHPAFHEVGRSGAPYDRATVIRFLATQWKPEPVLAWNHAVHRLGPDAALLTFQSGHRADDGRSLQRVTYRSSLWRRDGDAADGRWQLFYHQGTPTGDVPLPDGQ